MAVPHTNTTGGRNQLFTGAYRERGVQLSKVIFCIGPLSRLGIEANFVTNC